MINNYIMYLRKSRSDDPNETVEEVLAKHEMILQNFAIEKFRAKIDEKIFIVRFFLKEIINLH